MGAKIDDALANVDVARDAESEISNYKNVSKR